MSRGWRWVIGIVLVVVAALIILGLLFAYLGVGRGYPATYGGRSFQNYPWMYRMPMMGGYYMGWMGMALSGLLWLGLGVLIILGLVSLFRPRGQFWPHDKQPMDKPAAPPTESVKSTAEEAPVKPALEHCSSCGREVQPDWAICPYCGNKLDRPS